MCVCRDPLTLDTNYHYIATYVHWAHGFHKEKSAFTETSVSLLNIAHATLLICLHSSHLSPAHLSFYLKSF